MLSLRNLFSSSTPSASTVAQRQQIAQDTIARSESIIQAHAAVGASSESTFIPNQLPSLDPAACPNFPASEVKVVNADSFTVARGIVEESHGAIIGKNDKVKVAVLNLASDARRAGGWEMTLSKTQVHFYFLL